MALLEYALVNYTFFGKKARIAKKKLKESLRQKEREKAEQRKRTINLNSINQSKFKVIHSIKWHIIYATSKPFLATLTNIHQETDEADKKTENGQVRRRQAENKIETKRKFFGKRTKSLNVNFPAIKDVSIVDRVSRIVFPFTFMIFNLIYWTFYNFLARLLNCKHI